MNSSVRFLFLCIAGVLWGSLSVQSTAQDISALESEVSAIFERSCTAVGCHADPVPQLNLNLTQAQFFNGLVNKPSMVSPDQKLVDPGNPHNSYLVKKIKGEAGIIGLQMPMTGDKLSDNEISVIEKWITELGNPTQADNLAPRPEVASTAYPFYGWKVLNLPTSRTLDAGNLLFLISHRFNPKISDGYDSFYGLDGSGIIYISLGYAFTDNFLVALGRSNSSDDVELQARYGIMKQGGPKDLPIGISVQASLNFVTQEYAEIDSFAKERFKPTLQVSFTRQLGDNIGLAFVPGILLNPDETLDDEDPLITMGLGGRWRFTRTLSIVGEWVPIVSGYTRTLIFGNDIRFDSWGGGLEIATAGHVFQIVLTNSVGLTSDQYLRGGDLDVFEDGPRLGFNIFRTFN